MSGCCEDGFRLAAASECSLRSKARIDALFDDSRSACSSSWCARSSLESAMPAGCCDDEQQRRVNGAVQARIEAMFASVEAEDSDCAAAVLPVKYMGAAPVGGRVASVRGLQEPLRQLAERIGFAVSAELEVSRRGLTFRTSELHEKNNPFRRIAVWSALKLHSRRRHGSSKPGDQVYAFVPLVAEDRGLSSLTNSEERHAELYRTMRGLDKDVADYPPLFAVVMRRPGAARLLECHAFACRCEEDAVAAAATLYRALLADLDATSRRPRHNNGLGCVSLASLASGSVRETSPLSRRPFCPPQSDVIVEKVPPPPPPPPPALQQQQQQPVRPPRVKKNSVSSSGNTEDEASSSSHCANVSVIEKPRRKKKISDVKAEDVLEARSRRVCSPSRESSTESNVTPRRIESNSSSASSVLEQSNEERRMNAKNKIYGSRAQCQAVSQEVQVIEKIYDERKARNDVVEVYNGNKSSSDRQRSGSYDLGCCTENSLYESSRIYAKARVAPKPPQSKSQQRTPDAKHPTISSRKSASSSSSGRCAPSKPVDESPYGQHRRRSIASQNRDHFRDADKIYSLGPEDEYNIHEDRVYDVTRPGRQAPQGAGRDSSSGRSGKRLSRVNTMDLPGGQQPPVRRRSRAGSEPPSQGGAGGPPPLLRRSQSELDVEHGDLLTRVELPRRGSFLKPGSVRKRDGPEARTPLGFTELFHEFRNQEGLTSVDDILAAIIDPEGMSFNELKPLYKEFLLKLAATLTQDELYERSASIMRRRRRPQRRRSSRGLLRRAIKRSVSRLKSGSSGPTEFTSVIFPARRLNERASYASSSSGDKRTSPPHPRVVATKLSRKRSTAARCGSAKSRMGHTTSEDSDTCRRFGRSMATANRSSSGYVSCSECSYDSESCTCVSADKCYCSLSRKAESGPGPMGSSGGGGGGGAVASMPCSCDTDSCSESNKCYCARRPQHHQHHHHQPSILEQLRQKGIVPAESTLSRAASPDRAKTARRSRNLTTSKSLEYLKVQPSGPRANCADNLALDYELFRPGGRRRSSGCSSGSEKVLVVSARDPQGRLIYVGGSGREVRSSKNCRSGADTRHHEALSIKKSAEIAAVFGAPGPARIGRRPSSTSSLRSSVSLEAGLGYLP